MQPPKDGAGEGRDAGDRVRRRRAMEQREHEPEVVEDAPAFGALGRVALESRSGPRRQLGIEIGGHVRRRPPVVAPETQLVPKRRHLTCDPAIDRKGSQTNGMNRFG
jgi:hypothetical protein